ncbi:unnamed protein product, partial [Closterium sp. NIES-54]
LYFERVTELVLLTARPAPPATSSAPSPGGQQQQSVLSHALRSVAVDAGLHALLPYLVHFIADEVMRSLDDCALLGSLMRLARALLLNPHLHLEPYLHQLMPALVTCVVAKRLGERQHHAHWHLRAFTAALLALICL